MRGKAPHSTVGSFPMTSKSALSVLSLQHAQSEGCVCMYVCLCVCMCVCKGTVVCVKEADIRESIVRMLWIHLVEAAKP